MEETRTQHIIKEARETDNATEKAIVDEAAQIANELSNMGPNIEIDLKELSEHVRNGGWRLGLLVARSVEIGAGHGGDRRTNQASFLTLDEYKISLGAASSKTGISRNTVKKYLESWDMAATDGIVPPSSELTPGQHFEFDQELHTPKVWDSYFKPPTGNEKDPFTTQVNKSKAVETIEPDIFNSVNFQNQQEFSIDNVYTYGLIMERKGKEIQDNCLQAARELNQRLSTDPAE